MTSESGPIAARLCELGLTLPPATRPAGAYTTAVQSGSWLFLSGHLPKRDGAVMSGAVGGEVDLATAVESARQCALELLATIDAAVGLDSVQRLVKLTGFVNSVPGFSQQPTVINGASELLVSVFGAEIGTHARSAVGVAGLPLGATVELEAVVQIDTKP